MSTTRDIDALMAREFPAWAEGEANALGFDRAPGDTRVVVAMSGGVDSSVTAALLHEQGFEVIGITLQLYDHGVAVEKAGSCCAGRDIHDARNVASSLGIPHYVLDYESRFRQEVMEDFADSYMRGETPIPCVTCNQTVKFRDLMKAAKDLGADCLATGHYVMRSTDKGHGRGSVRLARAVDSNRDQSYFLFATTPEQLDYLRFPLGGLQKADVRALAARYGLTVADKPDSQDICFVPGGRYTDVIERLRPGAAEPGDIVDLSGAVLGQHQGIIHYTVGQRRGLGIGGIEAPLFVVRLEPGTRRVIVGPRAALLMRRITVRDMNWLGGDIPADGLAIGLKVRSTQEPVPARIFPISPGGGAEIRFDVPEAGVSAGQAAVCYGNETVLGGGWISGTTSAQAQLAAAE